MIADTYSTEPASLSTGGLSKRKCNDVELREQQERRRLAVAFFTDDGKTAVRYAAGSEAATDVAAATTRRQIEPLIPHSAFAWLRNNRTDDMFVRCYRILRIYANTATTGIRTHPTDDTARLPALHARRGCRVLPAFLRAARSTPAT